MTTGRSLTVARSVKSALKLGSRAGPVSISRVFFRDYSFPPRLNRLVSVRDLPGWIALKLPQKPRNLTTKPRNAKIRVRLD